MNKKVNRKNERNITREFTIISAVLFILTLLIFFTNILPQPVSEKVMGCLTFAVSSWFFIDHEIFNNTKRTVICVLLSLLFIVWGINAQHIFWITLANFPLSSIIVTLLAKKYLGAKLDIIYETNWDRLFWLLLFVIITLVSVFVCNPILKFLGFI